jgi:2-C-methyl-D-erythritol 4-phosphate cytidylyltransferase
MISQGIISDNIAKCKLYGSAIASITCGEAMLETENKEVSTASHNRDQLMRAQTPQAFPLYKLVWAHEESLKREIITSVASCTLMIELGEQVYFSAGSEKNIKLTTPDDIDIFKALLTTKKTKWLK